MAGETLPGILTKVQPINKPVPSLKQWQSQKRPHGFDAQVKSTGNYKALSELFCIWEGDLCI